jgi:hypothetical protein
MLTQGEGPEGPKWICRFCGNPSRGTSRSRQQPSSIELPALIGLGTQQGLGIDIGCGDGKLTDTGGKEARSICSA